MPIFFLQCLFVSLTCMFWTRERPFQIENVHFSTEIYLFHVPLGVLHSITFSIRHPQEQLRFCYFINYRPFWFFNGVDTDAEPSSVDSSSTSRLSCRRIAVIHTSSPEIINVSSLTLTLPSLQISPSPHHSSHRLGSRKFGQKGQSSVVPDLALLDGCIASFPPFYEIQKAIYAVFCIIFLRDKSGIVRFPENLLNSISGCPNTELWAP